MREVQLLKLEIADGIRHNEDSEFDCLREAETGSRRALINQLCAFWQLAIISYCVFTAQSWYAYVVPVVCLLLAVHTACFYDEYEQNMRGFAREFREIRLGRIEMLETLAAGERLTDHVTYVN